MKDLQIKVGEMYEPSLRLLARSRGKVRREPRGNVRELIEAIASGEIPLGDKMPVPAQEALLRLLNEAISNGFAEDVQIISEWLTHNAGVQSAIAVEARRLAELENDWVGQAKAFICDRTPFQIVTPRSSYNVLWADFWVPTEGQRRRQLLTWCEEVSDGDLPELAHNRTFKINRDDIVVVPLPNKVWRYQGLDTVEVTVQLRGSLARTYQRRPEDIREEITQIDDQIIRLVSKKIWSSFWLFQGLNRYGRNCVIREPAALREQFLVELKETVKRYEI